VNLCRAAAVLALLFPAMAQQPAEEGVGVTFQSETKLVLLPFRILHGKNYVTDMEKSAVTLLENGKPREFSIFDTPGSEGRLPIEIVLLFDTNPKIEYLWDPKDVFRFIPQWTDDFSRGVFQSALIDHAEKPANHPEVRISVYRCAGQALYRLTLPTTNPTVVTAAFRTILNPSSRETAATAIRLTLPPRRDRVKTGPFTDEYVTSYFVSAEHRGWPMEAAIGLLNEVSKAQDRVARVMVMFSEGIGATTTIPEDAGNQALDLGIPIYPIATNYRQHIQQRSYPRNYFRMQEFEALGKMTGGRAAELESIDAATMQKILEGVVRDVSAQYVVGFVPSSDGAAPKQHNLEIRLSTKSLGEVEGGKRRAAY
jgi:hypothetical protein